MNLKGKTAIVTGGNSGIGLSIVLELAKQGANIVIDYVVHPETAEALEKQVLALGDKAVAVKADVSKVADLQSLVDAAVKNFGRLDIMVNNAGVETRTSVLDTTEEQYQRVLDINLNGTFFACQSFARRVHAAQTAHPELVGSAILISSMSARIVNIPQFQASYHASKAAVSMLAKSLGVEWAPTGIRVNAVEPGYMLSDMTREFMDANPDLAGQWRSLIPAGRMGQPADLVGLVRFLASAESGYLTAQSIVLDGGYTAI